jgi:hypothetical protein
LASNDGGGGGGDDGDTISIVYGTKLEHYEKEHRNCN